MFAKACKKALKFTHPVVFSTRSVDGTLDSAVGTYFFISKDGWALTAAHIFNPLIKWQYDQKHIREMTEKKNKGEIEEPNLDPSWLTNQSPWFGADGIRLNQVHIFTPYDIAAMKLDNVPPGFLEETAVFGDADSLTIGTSLCRLGYPFINMKPEFENNNFRLPGAANNLQPFPNDGIYTRTIVENRGPKFPVVTYIETSTPGLKGQSGGPIFDVNGTVYGVQVKTGSLPLGLAPTLTEEGNVVTEHQFLNVGLAVHPAIIQKLLVEKNVPFETVSTDSDGSSYIIQ